MITNFKKGMRVRVLEFGFQMEPVGSLGTCLENTKDNLAYISMDDDSLNDEEFEGVRCTVISDHQLEEVI